MRDAPQYHCETPLMCTGFFSEKLQYFLSNSEHIMPACTLNHANWNPALLDNKYRD